MFCYNKNMSIENKNSFGQNPEQTKPITNSERLLAGIALGDHLLPASTEAEKPTLIDTVPGYEEVAEEPQSVEQPALIDTVPGVTIDKSGNENRPVEFAKRVPIDAPANPYGKLGYPYATREDHLRDLAIGVDKTAPNGIVESANVETMQNLVNRLGELPESKEQ